MEKLGSAENRVETIKIEEAGELREEDMGSVLHLIYRRKHGTIKHRAKYEVVPCSIPL